VILTTEQLNILNHIVYDGQEWANHAGEEAMLAKVEKYRQSYLDAQGDGYQTRKQKEDVIAQKIEEERLNVSYAVKRKREYPDIGDQLDMLWHAMDTGVLPKVDSFYDTIKTTKDKFPKE
jgi:hypothetical protein